MLPDKGGNRVELDGWRLETAIFIGHDNVLVSTDSFSVAAQAYICLLYTSDAADEL